MTQQDILIPVAVLSILRGDESVRCVAERFGVTEPQVQRWKDIFTVAGTLALSDLCKLPAHQPHRLQFDEVKCPGAGSSYSTAPATASPAGVVQPS